MEGNYRGGWKDWKLAWTPRLLAIALRRHPFLDSAFIISLYDTVPVERSIWS